MEDDQRDRREIYELVCAYCRGVDRLDLVGVRAVYTDDGVDHHTGFSGTADDFIVHLERVLARFDGTHHLMGTHLVEFHGDVAVAETYGMATHWGTPTDDPDLNYSSGFRYVDHLLRRGGHWKIRERWAVREWTHSNVGRHLPRKGEGPSGRRDEHDPLVHLLHELRRGDVLQPDRGRQS